MQWMQAALASAVQKGFVLPDHPEGVKDFGLDRDLGSHNKALVEALLALRKELAEVKVSKGPRSPRLLHYICARH